MFAVSHFVVLVLVGAICALEEVNPSYKYSYETEDVMKTDASSFPVHGYHVVEGGYYPEGNFRGGYGGGYGGGIGGGYGGGYGGGIGGGYGGGYGGVGGFNRLGYGAGGGRFIGGGGIGAGGIGLEGKFIGPVGAPFIGGGYGGGSFIGGGGGGGFIGGPGFVGAGLHHHGIGGEVLDKQEYSGGSKNLKDAGYESVKGSKGAEFNQEQEGYNKGQVGIKNSKGDSGYYSEVGAGKKAVDDGKFYHGAQQFDQEGKAKGENKQNEFHKKGHSIKGFKTSHHKDEDGKTEEFYDEEHNSGDNYNYGGQSGSYGKNAQSSYKGGHDNGEFNAVENKKQGQYDTHHLVDNNNADQGQYGEKKYAGNGESYGSHNGVDQHSLLGHQEANKVYKHHPYHVPFYPIY